jgi:hypothetical protein
MLQDNSGMMWREIAKKLSISTIGLNFCLKSRINKA